MRVLANWDFDFEPLRSRGHEVIAGRGLTPAELRRLIPHIDGEISFSRSAEDLERAVRLRGVVCPVIGYDAIAEIGRAHV